MDSTSAQKLMPVHLKLQPFIDAILENSDITDSIGTRITLNPPIGESETPYIYFTASEPTQKRTDDMQSIWFRFFMDWRLVAPVSWTQKDMRDLMESLMLELQQLQGTVVQATTVGNDVNAFLYLVDWKFSAHFPDENQKGYQSMIYTVDMEWK